MNETHRISVIVPTYNRAHTILRALDSIFAQSYPLHEVIVIDDGSSDDTVTQIKQLYPDVILIQQSNHGVSHARNRGIEVATGDWIALLDSDDSWHPEKLQSQISALSEQGDYKICHTEEIWYRNGKRVNPMLKHAKKGGWIFQDCLPLCRISPSSVMIHKELFASIGHFDESMTVCEDYDLWLRITARHPVLFLEQALTNKYGGHEDQLSQQYWGMDRFRIAALINIIGQDILSSDDRVAAVECLHEKVRIYAKGARKHQRFDEAQQYEKYLHEIL